MNVGDSRLAIVELPSPKPASSWLVNEIRKHQEAIQHVGSNGHLVLRTSSPETLSRLESSPALETLAPNSYIWAVGRSPMGSPIGCSLLHGPSDQSPLDGSLLNAFVRSAELSALAEESGAIYRADDCVFELPSGLHADSFIRFASVLTRPANIALVADWILPLLKNHDVVVADTGSILSLLEHLRCQASLDGCTLTVDAFAGYPAASNLAESLDLLRERHGDDKRIVFIVSVSSSGSTVRALEALKGVDDLIVIVVDATGSEEGEEHSSLCRFPVSSHKSSQLPTDTSTPTTNTGECSRCAGKGLLAIDTATYEVRSHYEWNRIKVSPTLAREGKPFWEAVERTDSLVTHGGDPLGVHRAYWIDVERLYSDQEMVETATHRLSAHSPDADLIVIPGGSAQEHRIAIASLALPSARILLTDRDDVSAADAEKIISARQPLILAEVAVSGWTLARFRERINYRCAALPGNGTNPAIGLFVLVLRPSGTRSDISSPTNPGANSRAEQRLARRYRTPTSAGIGFANRVYMAPDSRCPFCIETELLRSARQLFDRNDSQRVQINDRIRELNQTFAYDRHWTSAMEDPATHRTFGSFFGELSAPVAFAAAASAAERILLTFRDSRNGRTIDVVDVRAALEAYYDHVFLYGLFRTFPKGLLRGPGADSELMECISEWAQGPLPLASCQELAFAIACGNLPFTLSEVVTTAAQDDPYVKMMLRIAALMAR